MSREHAQNGGQTVSFVGVTAGARRSGERDGVRSSPPSCVPHRVGSISGLAERLMPEGLEARVWSQEMADLIAFVREVQQ
jgi:hypothetical protein